MAYLKTPYPSQPEAIPLFNIPDDFTLADVKAYKELAHLLRLRSGLDADKAHSLFKGLYELIIFHRVDLAPIRQVRGIPTGPTHERFIQIRNGLKKEFEQLGITPDDFKECEIKIQHPDQIDLGFITKAR